MQLNSRTFLAYRTELNVASRGPKFHVTSCKIIQILLNRVRFDQTNSIEFDSVRFDIPGKF
jgi:hypothetical protein